MKYTPFLIGNIKWWEIPRHFYVIAEAEFTVKLLQKFGNKYHKNLTIMYIWQQPL